MRAILKTEKQTIEKKGRSGDKKIGHLTPGEIVIPRAFAEDDDFRATINLFFKENDVDLREFIVGDSKNKTNSKTGYLEFGWNPFKSAKKLLRQPGKIFTNPKEVIEDIYKDSLQYKTFKEIKRIIPKPPKPPPLPAKPDPTPTPVITEEVTRAKSRARAKARKRGRAANILAGRMTTGRMLQSRQVLKTRVGE